MLPITYSFKNVTSKDKNFIREYLPKKLDRFKTLMNKYIEKECRLEVKAEQFATKSACQVETILHLPGKKLMAKEDDHTIIEATDLAIDKLITQLRKLVSK